MGGGGLSDGLVHPGQAVVDDGVIKSDQAALINACFCRFHHQGDSSFTPGLKVIDTDLIHGTCYGYHGDSVPAGGHLH